MNTIMKTGIRTLDKELGGGFRKQSLNLFGGPPCCGKTFYLAKIGTKLAQAGYNGLMLSMETDIAKRIPLLSDVKGVLWSSVLKSANFNVREIESKMKDIQNNSLKNMFSFDFICLDNVYLMSKQSGYTYDIYEEIRKLAYENNVAIIGTIQTKRNANTEQFVVNSYKPVSVSETYIQCENTKNKFGKIMAECILKKSRYTTLSHKNFTIELGNIQKEV